jgi:hypothetical protein
VQEDVNQKTKLLAQHLGLVGEKQDNLLEQQEHLDEKLTQLGEDVDGRMTEVRWLPSGSAWAHEWGAIELRCWPAGRAWGPAWGGSAAAPLACWQPMGACVRECSCAAGLLAAPSSMCAGGLVGMPPGSGGSLEWS